MPVPLESAAPNAVTPAPEPPRAPQATLDSAELGSAELGSAELGSAELGSAELDAFVAAVRAGVDARLAAFFAAKRTETERISPRSVELVAALESLTMRGGKRLRPVIAAAAMLAVDEEAPLESAVDLGAALELLQTYLLAHDDFMDGDLERRGGPAVHAIFRTTYGDDHLGDSLGVLGGDLASAYSLELFLGAPFAPARLREALDALLDLRKEVYFGQHLDIVGDADVARMHDLKTGSYTVRGPARLGAMLGGADASALATLRAWADPLGEAFQLADDLLGTFGDARAMGKPGEDLRHGKRTSLVVEAETRLPPTALAALRAVLGNRDATDDAIAAVVVALEEHGVRAAVEARAAERLAQSLAALHATPALPSSSATADGLAPRSLRARGKARLAAIGRKLVVRDR